MIEVKEAFEIIRQSALSLPSEQVSLHDALGRVLHGEVYADMDFPPFDRVSMDGIAIKYEDFAKGIREFRIVGIQPAGAPQKSLNSHGECIEVMTGAVAPEDADTVIPYEHIEIKDGVAHVVRERVRERQNIHPQGTDKKKGDLLIGRGTLIGAPEIAVAASVGCTQLEVVKNPAVAIISTGNELVEIDQKPLPHQIRRSNVHAIAAELHRVGIQPVLYHLQDEKEKIRAQVEKLLHEFDVLLLSGGVSKGKFDFVPQILEEVGVEKQFHRVNQKPGKPFWFGKRNDGKVVFAFPGNPVSTFFCYHRYFVPWLQISLGAGEMHEKKAILAEDLNIRTQRPYFMQVWLQTGDDGCLYAVPKMGKGSGDHANLLVSNAFMHLPGNTDGFRKGEVFDVFPFREL